MLSSDKNIESIVQLVEVLKRYLGLQKEFVKLSLVEKFVRLMTALTLTVVFVFLGFAVLFNLSFAFVYWLSPTLGVAAAFLLVAFIHLFLLCVVFYFRKAWIERPLVRFLADVLFN